MKRGFKKEKYAIWQHALRGSESKRQKTERALIKSEREKKEVIQEKDNLAGQLARMSLCNRKVHIVYVLFLYQLFF